MTSLNLPFKGLAIQVIEDTDDSTCKLCVDFKNISINLDMDIDNASLSVTASENNKIVSKVNTSLRETVEASDSEDAMVTGEEEGEDVPKKVFLSPRVFRLLDEAAQFQRKNAGIDFHFASTSGSSSDDSSYLKLEEDTSSDDDWQLMQIQTATRKFPMRFPAICDYIAHLDCTKQYGRLRQVVMKYGHDLKSCSDHVHLPYGEHPKVKK